MIYIAGVRAKPGYKLCPNCAEEVSVRTNRCRCDFDFVQKRCEEKAARTQDLLAIGRIAKSQSNSPRIRHLVEEKVL